MRSGQIYKNKVEPWIRLRITHVKGDDCSYIPADEYSEEELRGYEALFNCKIKELLELYEIELDV